MGRRRNKDQRDREDRDKTLEPDRVNFTPLTRSATTILSSGAVAKKESTPYRLLRNYSSRKPTLSGISMNKYSPRNDFTIPHHSASFTIPKSNLYESPTMRHKDSVYDLNGKRVSSSSRHNEYDNLGLSTKTGQFEGRDKENIFKSKYEPSRLYAELNNNETFSRDRNVSRCHKDYRRTATTNFNNYTDNFVDAPTASNSYRDRNVTHSRYAPEKSLEFNRSNTQKFFDLESKSSMLRNLNDNEVVKSEAVKEREARRKEIQGLIAKYAQIDDVFSRAIDNTPSKACNAGNSISNDYNRLNSMQSNGIFDGTTSDFLINNNNNVIDKDVSQYPHMQITTFMPLSKTQSVSSMSSTNRSRIPKTLSTFVRKR